MNRLHKHIMRNISEYVGVCNPFKCVNKRCAECSKHVESLFRKKLKECIPMAIDMVDWTCMEYHSGRRVLSVLYFAIKDSMYFHGYRHDKITTHMAIVCSTEHGSKSVEFKPTLSEYTKNMCYAEMILKTKIYSFPNGFFFTLGDYKLVLYC